MKKIVFINPKTTGITVELFSSEIVRLSDEKTLSIPRLGPMIFAALTPPEYQFIFVDDDYSDVDLEMEADLVALSAMTVQINRAYEIADHFRGRGITVVIGGIHASVLPEEVSEHCDATMIGEGESTWPAMLQDFAEGTLKKFYNAKDYPPVTEMISPKVDAINHEHYLMFPVQATRGCPYDCDFCSAKHATGDRYKMKPVAQVVGEIKEYEKINKKKFGYKKIYYFVDENLYVNRKYAKELFTEIAKLDIQWTGQGTVDAAFDEEMLELMARSGCTSYAIGLESISEETLAEANKPKVNQSKSYDVAIKNLTKHGIIPAGYLIYGFDTDTPDVFQNTVAFVKENHLMQPFFGVLTPYPGTRLHERIEKDNRIFDRNWDNYNSMTIVFHPKHYSAELVSEGVVWSAKQVGNFAAMKETLDYFWRHGPWPHLKTLTFKERSLLRLLGAKMKRTHPQYCEFLNWAAGNKNACGFGTIYAALHLHDAIMQSDKGENFEALVEAERSK